MKILVTGGTGLVASELKKIVDPNKYFFASHAEMDITDADSVKRCFYEREPDLVLHLAALTDVMWGDRQKDLFYKVNVLGTRNIANCSDNLIYFSTEYIYDGKKGDYNEYDSPNPLNYYGLSKLLGEYEARRAEKSIVIRTALKPRPYKHDVVPAGMYSTGGYIDDMAKEFKLAIENFSLLPSTVHIGLEKKLIKDLAEETRKVKVVDINSFPVKLPLDSSLDTSLWRRIKKRL